MDSSNNETVLETPHPPHKKARHWKRELEALQDEESWYIRMSQVREKHLVRAVYENAMNCLIEGSGRLRRVTIEDEAVTMAIRCHGLACSTEELRPTDEEGTWPTEDASTSAVAPCSTSTEDILSHAVTAAIRKKGLGAVDR